MQTIPAIKQYIRDRQTPLTATLHIVVICLVLSQIIVSNFMGFTNTGEISKNLIHHYGTWIHIITGLITLPIALVFIYVVLKNRGLNYFFPHKQADYAQIKNDFKQLKNRKLPEANAMGIAAVVQGLGLGALIVVLLSGLIWYLSWSNGLAWSGFLKETHENLTSLLITYMVGHGCMGVLHMYFAIKQKSNQTE